MSYNQAYGQPQADMQIPFPTNQFVAAPLQVQRGMPPFQVNIPVPAPLQQYLPLIVTDCIDAIQSKAGANPLRVFLFNELIQNNYNNPKFFSFVDGVVKLLDMKMATGKFQNIIEGIFNCANFYAELQTGVSILQYPALQQFLDANMGNAVREVLHNWQATKAELENYYSMQNRGGFQGQQPMQHGQFIPQGGFLPNQGGPVNSAQWRQGGGVQMSNGAHMNPGGGNSPFVGGNFVVGDPIAQRYESSGRAQRQVQPEPSHARNIHDVNVGKREEHRQAVLQNTPKPQVVAQTPAAPVVKAADPTAGPNGGRLVKASTGEVLWSPSEKHEFNLAFNPEKTEVVYEILKDGKMHPYIRAINKESSQMDINKHLNPSYAKAAPVGIGSLDTAVRVMETAKSLNEDAAAIQELKPSTELNVAQNGDTGFMANSDKEAWLNNGVHLAQMKKKNTRTNVFRSIAVQLEPLVCTFDPRPMIVEIAAQDTFSAACKVMQEFKRKIDEGSYAGGDAASLTFINNRLTAAVTNFLKKGLAVPLGWPDSFMEDAMEIIGFLERKYGKAWAEALLQAQGDIIDKALSFLEEDSAMQQNTNLFPNEEDIVKAMGHVTVVYFYEYITYTSLDLLSHELKMEIPKSEVSVGLFEHQTPLMRQLAENILTHARQTEVRFTKHLVRTADGAELEITQSVLRPDVYLVCPASL